MDEYISIFVAYPESFFDHMENMVLYTTTKTVIRMYGCLIKVIKIINLQQIIIQKNL